MLVLLIALLLAIPAFAQPPAFEVASIKPAAPEARGMSLNRDPAGGIVGTNLNIRTLIILAYHVQDFQLSGGPAWIRTDRFDIAAKPPAGSPKDVTWPMLMTLLADRCKLVVHREFHELPIYSLVVAKGGSKLQPLNRPPNPSIDGAVRNGPGTMTATGLTMQDLGLSLSGMVRRKVTDRTGLSGRFDFKLEYTPDYELRPDDTGKPAVQQAPQFPDRPPLLMALEQQLGLKLEPAKGPVEVIVIDSIEKPTAN